MMNHSKMKIGMMTKTNYYVYFRGLVWGGFETEQDANNFTANRWYRGFTNYKIFRSMTGQIPDSFRDKIELGQTVQINFTDKYYDLPRQSGEVVSTKDYPVCLVKLPGRKYPVGIHIDKLTSISPLKPIIPVPRPVKEGF